MNLLHSLIGIMGTAPHSSLPAPTVSSISANVTKGTLCNKGVPQGNDTLTVTWSISLPPGTTGYTAKLYLNDNFNRNVLLGSTGTTMNAGTVAGGPLNVVSVSFQFRLDIVNVNNAVVSSQTSNTVTYNSGTCS